MPASSRNSSERAPRKRISKPPEVRREELLDCAQALFVERGYDDTTVNDIVARAQVSKGAFYHYFESKEAMLEALADRMVRQSVSQVEDLLTDSRLGAVERLNAFLARSREVERREAPAIRAAFDVIFRPENQMLYARTSQAVNEAMAPIFAQLIEDGRAAGAFRTPPNSEAIADILLQINAGQRKVMTEVVAAAGVGEQDRAAARLEERLQIFGLAMDRILGLPDGTIQMTEPGFAEVIVGAAPRRPE